MNLQIYTNLPYRPAEDSIILTFLDLLTLPLILASLASPSLSKAPVPGWRSRSCMTITHEIAWTSSQGQVQYLCHSLSAAAFRNFALWHFVTLTLSFAKNRLLCYDMLWGSHRFGPAGTLISGEFWGSNSCNLRVLLRSTAARHRCALRISVCSTSKTWTQRVETWAMKHEIRWNLVKCMNCTVVHELYELGKALHDISEPLNPKTTMILYSNT